MPFLKNGILIAHTAEDLLKLAGLISPESPLPPFREGRRCLRADRAHLFLSLWGAVVTLGQQLLPCKRAKQMPPPPVLSFLISVPEYPTSISASHFPKWNRAETELYSLSAGGPAPCLEPGF